MKSFGTVLGCIIAMASIALSAGCYKDNKEAMYPSVNCDTTNVTWTKDIKSIVTNSCATSGCHDAAASGGYNLTTYSGVKTMVDNRRFLEVIELGTMPKNSSKLDNCTINKVRRWINNGALEN